jgi:very-short-patch-repair endonuclease
MSGAQEQDKIRQEHIEAFGIKFLRFNNNDVCKNIDGVCEVIFEKIGEIQNVERKKL